MAEEKDAMFKFFILNIICIVALFLEFILTLALPAGIGWANFYEQPSSIYSLRPRFQLGLCLFTTIAGMLICVVGILNYLDILLDGKHWLLLLVPLQIVLAVFNLVCFVLWALLTERWSQFGAGLFFAFLAIIASFGVALAATGAILVPQNRPSSTEAAVVAH